MDTQNDFQFDFEFGGESRQALLSEARKTLTSLDFHLGEGDRNAPRTAAEEAAANLLRQLEEHVAEFGDNPQLLELREQHFQLYGWPVPKQFRQLSKNHRFYWMRVPVLLQQLENMPFSKLKLAIEFNPGAQVGALRPISVMIFPDKKVKMIANLQQGARLKVGENFDLELDSGNVNLEAGDAQAKLDAGIDLGAKGNFGLTIGPFSYDLKKLELDHTDPGLEKVFWSVYTAKYLHEERPTFIVLIQVPNQLKDFEIAAAMQASHQFDLGAAAPSDVFKYFRQKVANFFRQGAPIQSTKVWNIPLE